MKMIVKIATCGVLALAMQVAQAESVQLAANAAKKIANSPTAREFVQKNSGVAVTASMTTAELAAAIGSSKTLSLGEQIALIKAINSYANVASVDANQSLLNEGLAVSKLKDKSGNLLQVASWAKDSGTRTGAEQAGSCSKSVDPVAAAAGTSVSYANYEAAIKAGNIKASLDCTEQIEKMGEKARENIGETGTCMTNRGSQFKTADARGVDADECLLTAINNDGSAPIDIVAAHQRRVAQEGKCDLFNTGARYRPAARN